MFAAAVWLRRRHTLSFWPYVIGPGALSWAGLYVGGFHPALALVPIVPFMPHSPADLGLFDRRELLRTDTLNRFEHWWLRPVQFVLLLFGAKKLPELARGVGKSMGEFKKAREDFEKEITRSEDEVKIKEASGKEAHDKV